MMPAQKTRKNGSVMDMYYGAGEQSRKKAKKDVVIAGLMRKLMNLQANDEDFIYLGH
jgi:hypothetical protein